jgi:methyl-accepting chemotaxis protein
MRFHLFRLDSISKKLILPTLLLVTLLIGALGGVLVVQQQRGLNAMMESKADSLVTMLATISVQYLINYDLSALESFVKETAKDKDVAFAEYYDAEGKSYTGNVMTAPADTSHLLVHERDIVDTSGKKIGKVKVGYTTTALDNMLQSSIEMVAASVLAVLALLAFGLAIIVRGVARPAVKIQEGLTLLAQGEGDLTARIDVRSNDELGRIVIAFNQTMEKLHELVAQIRNISQSLDSGIEDIARGNADLSQRTEEQASSLEETAASMEELISTVRQNTENAKQANQLASNASDIAVKGGQAVGDVVHTMASISDSSKKIVDIISVIEGIAFQTNILALNAAVEAARAGEQGRGFAVVAGEVRNLAQRSAAAAREIKTLIDDSVNKVDAGTRQVGQAGATMTEIVQAVKRVTDIMAEIAAASNEQSAGIGQVNQAIVQMDEVTQQNAALVEEAAAAAEAMREQSGELMEAVSVFKLKAGDGSAQKTGSGFLATAIDGRTKKGPAKPEVLEMKGRKRVRRQQLAIAEAAAFDFGHTSETQKIS